MSDYARTEQRERFGNERARNAIIRHLFQALVVGSGVDWSSPSHADLAATMQLLGDDDGFDE